MKKHYITGTIAVASLCLSLAVAYLMVTEGMIIFPIVLVAIVGLVLTVAILYDFSIGVYALLFSGSFIFFIDRLFDLNLPLGVGYDGLVILTFFAVFVKRKQPNDWSFLNNSITVTFVIITLYQLAQFFNPNAVSHIGWLVSMRNNTSFLLFIIFFQLFYTINKIERFTTVWLGLAAIVAFYGIYQEVFGLADFEWRWVNEVPERIKLYFIWGSLRKFSILSDPAAFGMFTAFSGLACLALATGPYRGRYRFLFFCLAVIMFVSMSFSGTRSAFAMTAAGVFFLVLLNIQSGKVMVFSVAAALVAMVLFFGPFYGGTINRIRSTFQPQEDASMGVRDIKRLRWQGYMLDHPIGGGLYTTGANGVRYSSGHVLAEGWDPDSGYLLTALELGWIGLIIFMAFFFIAIYKGIINHFTLSNPRARNLNLVYLVPFFALSLAHFTQDAMFQKPVTLIIIATYAIVVRLHSFEQNDSDSTSNSEINPK